MLKQVAAAIPADFRQNIIIVGSLAAGYHFFGDNSKLQVRTKDVDCLLAPRIQAIPAGQAVADRLFAENWQLRAEGDWGKPGSATTPVGELPVVRLHPPGSTEWFIELLTVPESESDLDRKDIRLVTSQGHFSNFVLVAKNGAKMTKEDCFCLAKNYPYCLDQCQIQKNEAHNRRDNINCLPGMAFA